MSELLAILTNTRRIKAALKVLPLAEAQLIKEKVAAAVAQLEEEAQDEIRAEEERKAKIQEVIAKAKELGISVSELAGNATGTTKPKGKRATSVVAAKYEWFIDGERHIWSGRGRMPVELRNRVEQGTALDSFLIKS